MLRAVDNRGTTVAIFIGVLTLTIGLLGSGAVRVVMFPEVPGDFIRMELQMQSGTAPEIRNAAMDRIEAAILDLNEEYILDNPGLDPMIAHVGSFTNGDTGALSFVEMPMVVGRALNGDEISDLWRERVGEIPGVKELTFSGGNNFGGGAALSFRLSSDNYLALESAADELEIRMGEFEGVFDIRKSSFSGGQEIKLSIKPAESAAPGMPWSVLRPPPQA